MSAILHFNPLRAARDVIAEDLKPLYFDSHPEWIDAIALGEFWCFDKAIEHLRRNHYWGLCNQLRELRKRAETVRNAEQIECARLRAQRRAA